MQEKIAAERCASMVGTRQRVLFEEKAKKEGIINARTSGNIVVEVEADESLIGHFGTVEITDSGNWVLKGKPVEE